MKRFQESVSLVSGIEVRILLLLGAAQSVFPSGGEGRDSRQSLTNECYRSNGFHWLVGTRISITSSAAESGSVKPRTVP